MEFNQLIQDRRSVRAFRPDSVPDETVEALLAAAVRAPSAGNLQAWEFVVVRDSEARRRLARAAFEQTFIAQAPVVIVTCRNLERNTLRYGARGRDFYSLIDTSCASMLLLLAARDQGLGACFVGAYRDAEVCRILRLPGHIRPVGIIPIGHPAESPPRPEPAAAPGRRPPGGLRRALAASRTIAYHDFAMPEVRPEPPGDPINYFFREALLIGGQATRLYLVRHAQSEGNTGEDLTTGDPDLTEIGREQARRLAERLRGHKIDAIYSSPLRRAQETALYIADATGLDVLPKADLREVELGREDLDIRILPPEQQAQLARRIVSEGTWDAFPGSEGSANARRRVAAVIGEIVAGHPGERVVVVCHSAFIQTFISVVLGLRRDFVFYPFNASINSVRAQDGRYVIWRLNDVSHLDGLPAGFGGIS